MKYNTKKAREKQKQRDEEIRKFLEVHPEATLMEVGEKYDLTKQRIHQIIAKEVGSEEVGKIEIKIKR